MSEMRDKKPYLLRAIFEWLLDSDCTPYLLVARPDCGWVSGLPEHLLQQDSVVLNVSPRAAPDFRIEEEALFFSTRFSGQSRQIVVAMEAVAALFAQENQEGMMFEVDSELLAKGAKVKSNQISNNTTTKASKKSASHLKILK